MGGSDWNPMQDERGTGGGVRNAERGSKEGGGGRGEMMVG